MDWMNTFKQVAPALEAGLSMTGPVGMAAAAGLSAILGTDSKPDSVKAALANATPEQLIAIKELDYKFQTQWKQMGVDLLKSEGDDRKSARDMAISTKDHMVQALASAYTIGYFTILILMMIGTLKVPISERDVFIGLIGTLSAAQLQILNFYFGKSSNDAQTAQMLYNSTPSSK